METMQEIYEKQLKELSVPDRLQLVRLIMNDLAESASRWIVEESDTWSEEDLNDANLASMRYASLTLLAEDGDD